MTRQLVLHYPNILPLVLGMPPKKRRNPPEQLEPSAPSKKSRIVAQTGSAEVAANANRGFLKLPPELWDEIFQHFYGVDLLSRVPGSNDDRVLPPKFLQKSDALRSLSQLCVAYRKIFLPILWESFMVCFNVRGRTNGEEEPLFFRHVGQTLLRKCDGLTSRADLHPLIKFCNCWHMS